MIDTIVLACYYYMIPKNEFLILEGINLFFVIMFTLEALMKIIALGKLYFLMYWNRFDFGILFLTFATIAVYNATGKVELIAVLRVLRVFRILKLLKLMKLVVNVKKLEMIQRTISDTTPVLGTFSLLLLLFLYMCTVIAVQLFALIDLSSPPGIDREMGYHVNF